MRVAGMIRNALYSCGVANVDVLRIVRRVKGDTTGMVKAGCEFLDLRGFAIGANAAKEEDRSGAGVREEKIAVGRRADEARHAECSPAESHRLLVVCPLHGG
jgi:hypothetical protein